MKKFMLLLIIIMPLLSVAKSVVNEDIYPKAEKGMKKYVIVLEEKEKEDNYILKLKFGKEKLVDCNNHSLSDGKIEERNLEGYGYNYYIFTGSDRMISTQKLCIEQTKVKKDIYYNVEKTIRYNSKLPVVIYAPEGIFVNYNIYEKIADENLK